MELDRTTRAHIIIHGFAVAAAATSAVSSLIPFIGPLAGDTIALTALTIGMTVMLADLFEKKLEEGALTSFAAVIVGMTIGTALGKGLLSLLPGIGSVANAAATFTLHEATGWGIFLIFERGGDPTKLSKNQIEQAISASVVQIVAEVKKTA